MSEEIIELIYEKENFTIFDGNLEGIMYEGYIISTNKRNIKLGIDMRQELCKTGYFMSEDDTYDFRGAKYLGIEIVNKQLKSKIGFDENNLHRGDVVFVNINTDRGVLQFVAYNAHNGYYGVNCTIAYEELIYQKRI